MPVLDAPRPEGLGPYGRALLAWVSAFTATLAVASWSFPLRSGVAAAASAAVADVVFLVASLWLLGASARISRHEPTLALLMVSSLAANGLLVPRLRSEPALRLILQAPVLLLTAGCLARLLVARIERSWHIAAAAAVGLLADLWSVFSASGVTRELLERHPASLDYLLLGFPVPGSGVRPILGVSDYAFFAIFVAHAERFGLGRDRSAAVLAGALLATLAAVNLLGIGLPAVPAMALAFVALHARALLGDFRLDFAAWRRNRAAPCDTNPPNLDEAPPSGVQKG